MNLKENILTVIGLLLLTVIYLLLFANASSPLTLGYPMDSTNFMIMGKMLFDGKVPYVDFFDHKGPSLIFIEAFGQLFAKYRNGVFVLEVINMFFVLFVIYKMARLRLTIINSWGVVLILLILLKYLFSAGNSTEELSLLATFISLYYLARYLILASKPNTKEIFFISLCFSFVFWMRPNNALIIMGVMLFFFLIGMIEKKWVEIKNMLIYIFWGQLPFSLFYLCYFTYHGAWSEMIYSTFIFNWKYANADWTINGNMWWMNAILICSLVVGSMTFFYFKSRKSEVLLCAIILLLTAFFSANIGYGLSHYFINVMPVVVVSCLLFLVAIDEFKRLNLAATVIIILLFVRLLYYGFDWMFTTRGDQIARYEMKEQVYKEIYENIPQSEKNRLFIYDTLPEIYPLLGINPNYKYFILQEWMGHHDNRIYDDIEMMMNGEDRPLWIIVYSYKIEENHFENERFIKRLTTEFIELKKIGDFSLYKRL